MGKETLLRFFLAIIVIIFVLTILVWNISLRRKVHVDHEQYRTLVHVSIKECIEADGIEDPLIALLKLERAQTSLQTLAQLVGGMDTLKFLSGLDVKHIFNTITYQERKIRAYASQLSSSSLVKPHPLATFSHELASALTNADEQSRDAQLSTD